MHKQAVHARTHNASKCIWQTKQIYHSIIAYMQALAEHAGFLSKQRHVNKSQQRKKVCCGTCLFCIPRCVCVWVCVCVYCVRRCGAFRALWDCGDVGKRFELCKQPQKFQRFALKAFLFVCISVFAELLPQVQQEYADRIQAAHVRTVRVDVRWRRNSNVNCCFVLQFVCNLKNDAKVKHKAAKQTVFHICTHIIRWMVAGGWWLVLHTHTHKHIFAKLKQTTGRHTNLPPCAPSFGAPLSSGALRRGTQSPALPPSFS